MWYVEDIHILLTDSACMKLEIAVFDYLKSDLVALS